MNKETPQLKTLAPRGPLVLRDAGLGARIYCGTYALVDTIVSVIMGTPVQAFGNEFYKHRLQAYDRLYRYSKIGQLDKMRKGSKSVYWTIENARLRHEFFVRENHGAHSSLAGLYVGGLAMIGFGVTLFMWAEVEFPLTRLILRTATELCSNGWAAIAAWF